MGAAMNASTIWHILATNTEHVNEVFSNATFTMWDWQRNATTGRHLKYNMNELMYNVWPWDTGFEIVPQYNEWQTSPGRVVNAGIKPGCSHNAWESGTQTRVISNGGTLDWVTRLEWHNGTGCVGMGHRLAYNGQDAGSMLRQSWVKAGGRPSQNAWYWLV